MCSPHTHTLSPPSSKTPIAAIFDKIMLAGESLKRESWSTYKAPKDKREGTRFDLNGQHAAQSPMGRQLLESLVHSPRVSSSDIADIVRTWASDPMLPTKLVLKLYQPVDDPQLTHDAQ